MEKVYIPARRTCCLCETVDSNDYRMVGFKDKPKRWVFCSDCFVKWMGLSNMRDGKCPRNEIFKVLAR